MVSYTGARHCQDMPIAILMLDKKSTFPFLVFIGRNIVVFWGRFADPGIYVVK